ncbi:MAG: TolC family outer membrane protein [Paracoccaceae bacterium]
MIGRAERKARRLWGFAAAVLCSTALSSAASGETLADAFVMAYKNSPELSAGLANVRVLSEQAVQAASGGRPQVQGTINLTSQFLNLEEFIFPTTMQLDVTQTIYSGGQVENATEAAETRITAEQARLITTEQTVLLNTVAAYMDVRRDQTLVSLGKNNVRVINEQLRAARERFDVGEVTRTDVAQAESRIAAARASLAASEGQLEISREAYKRVVGEYPGRLSPPPPLPDLPKSLDEAIAITLTDEPTVRAARLERMAASSDVRTAVGALLPQVNLLGQVVNQDTLNIENDGGTDASVGLQIIIPFYSGGFNYSNVREAQAQVDAREADIETALRNAAQGAGNAWSDLKVARSSIKAGQLQVRAAQIAFDGVREEAKVGARTTLDVLDAEQELLGARADLATAGRDQYVAGYSVLFAVGKLTTKHLGLELGDIESVTSYYDSVRDKNFGYTPDDDTVWSLSYRP